jgi:hypothetical protein
MSRQDSVALMSCTGRMFSGVSGRTHYSDWGATWSRRCRWRATPEQIDSAASYAWTSLLTRVDLFRAFQMGSTHLVGLKDSLDGSINSQNGKRLLSLLCIRRISYMFFRVDTSEHYFIHSQNNGGKPSAEVPTSYNAV